MKVDGFEVGCAAARREKARTVAIEAELKARVTDPESVFRALAAITPADSAVYQDQYFDSADGAFKASGRELRIRTVGSAEMVRHILTFKAPAVDGESGSKPEYETVVADPDATAAIPLGLGYRTLVSFSKHCMNHRMQRAGRHMLATVVTVPEIDGTFLEVETLTDDVGDVPAALAAVRAVMAEVGIAPGDFTTELYTDAVLRTRSSRADAATTSTVRAWDASGSQLLATAVPGVAATRKGEQCPPPSPLMSSPLLSDSTCATLLSKTSWTGSRSRCLRS